MSIRTVVTTDCTCDLPDDLMDKLGLKKSILPKLINPGTKVGVIKKEICEEL